jgi:hypothetical protein
MEKQTYRFEAETHLDELRHVPKEVIEKEVIFKFLKELPIDKLKELISLQEIDPRNKELWRKFENQKLLEKLQWSRTVMFRAEIEL